MSRFTMVCFSVLISPKAWCQSDISNCRSSMRIFGLSLLTLTGILALFRKDIMMEAVGVTASVGRPLVGALDTAKSPPRWIIDITMSLNSPLPELFLTRKRELFTSQKEKSGYISVASGIVPLESKKNILLYRHFTLRNFSSIGASSLQRYDILDHDYNLAHAGEAILPGTDPRGFQHRGQAWFWSGTRKSWTSLVPRNTTRKITYFIHNIHTDQTWILDTSEIPAEGKNWMPFIWMDKIHFVHSLDPLKILRADPDPVRSDVMVVRTVVDQGNRDGADPFRYRGGSASLLIQTNINPSMLVGIGHHTERNHSQRGFLFITDLSKLSECSTMNSCRPSKNEVFTRMTPPFRLRNHPNLLFPISFFFQNGKAFITATESRWNWFISQSFKNYGAVRNFLYEVDTSWAELKPLETL